ncbi:putative Hsp70 nucleotide exchange factor [Lineolata rhizophorae]|uniref:Putative Hsp70 nucleotide exchange factor n=1 Tax=Lineolata rhizophorae TaxID=578093 RepID=A0A6A6PEA0_9PEZI|nr:putative Hsp70 nucleotide exchange factor [Lineolata rhizophorae]
MDPGLNELLRWSVENSDASRGDPGSQINQGRSGPRIEGLTAEALQSILGGPSDADRMRDAMTAIMSPDVDLDNKLTAFDNFEQLVENLDNANNMEVLGLWDPLVRQLQREEKELRKMAAWCLGTAVQNNVKGQEKMLSLGVLPTLVDLSLNDEDKEVRKKAIRAVSSGVRNFQPGLDEAMKTIPDEHKGNGEVDASQMDQVDTMIQSLRDKSEKLG